MGASVAGSLGFIAGAVIGMSSYPPTAWFAVLEVGIPAAALGMVLGFGAGVVRALGQRRARRTLPTEARSHRADE